jgi:hypothetical protein
VGDGWTKVAIDDVTLAAFIPSGVELVRADPAPGVFVTAWVDGDTRLDLGIAKSEAFHIPDLSPISVYDWDWNESMVAAEAELGAQVLVEAVVSDAGDISVSIEQIEIDNVAA